MQAAWPQNTESECLAATDTLQTLYGGTLVTSTLSRLSLVAGICLLCTQHELL